VPNFGQHLVICQIVEIELLDEGVDYMNFRRSPQVHISLFSRVTKEGRVPQGGGGRLLMSFSQIPRETVDEASLKDS
jgi:hypothetical protein